MMRLSRKFFKHFPVLIVLLSFHAQAALHLELTQGINSAMPIAIVPFSNEHHVVPGKTTLTAVVASDLQHSGEFRVTVPDSLANQPTALPDINVPYWRAQGVNALVMGRESKVGDDQYRVQFELINLYSQSKQLNAKAVLLKQSFTVDQKGLRTLAHHISDLIYQKLTGVRGIFSTKIAYVLVKRGDAQKPVYFLKIADADGFSPQTLVRSSQPIMSPTWAPDGKSIAYVSFEHHEAAIYLQQLTTGQRELVSRFPGINGAPAFSPDGKKLALVLTKTGNPKIYTLDLASHALTQITHGYSIDTEPAWSPKGNTLYFTSSRAGNPQIFAYDFATKKVSRVTFDGKYNARACLTPNGKMMVVMHEALGIFGIAKQNLDTGRVTTLTASGTDESPSLAPNGKMILYGTQFAGHEVLGLISIDGRIRLRLPSEEGDVQDPAWSPYLSA